MGDVLQLGPLGYLLGYASDAACEKQREREPYYPLIVLKGAHSSALTSSYDISWPSPPSSMQGGEPPVNFVLVFGERISPICDEERETS